MAKFKLKLDTGKIKELVVAKGEVVGVCVAAGLVVLCFGIAVLALLGSRSPASDIKKDAEAVKSRMDSSVPTNEKVVAHQMPKWQFKSDSLPFFTTHWFDGSGTGSNKREKPILLAVDATRLKYVLGGAYTYEVDAADKTLLVFDNEAAKKDDDEKPLAGQAKDQFEPVQKVRPTRMVVVSATFPYKDQVDLFMKALRLHAEEDLFEKNLQPMFRGINVLRTEVVSGKAPAWEKLYTYQEDKDRVEAAKNIQDFLAEAVFDEDNLIQLAPFLTPNAATPLPKLATGAYDINDWKMDGINPVKIRKDKTGGGTGKMPGVKTTKGGSSAIGDKFGKKEKKKMPDGAEETAAETTPVPWKKLPQDMIDKTTGNFNPVSVEKIAGKLNVVSPDGIYEEMPTPVKEGDLKENKGVIPPSSGTKKGKSIPMQMPGKGTKGTKQPGTTKSSDDGDVSNGYAFTRVPDKGKALIRFIDVDVKPGATYKYKIQVVLANPNYKQENDVTHADVALPKILMDKDKFIETPTVTIPREYAFYVYDQASSDDGKYDPKLIATRVRTPNTIDYQQLTSDKVPVQIHKWVGKAKDGQDYFEIADWVIAERLFVHRGDKIGRGLVEVEVPVWNLGKDQFEIGAGVVKVGVVKKKDTKETKVGKVITATGGVPIDFLPRSADDTDLAPVVVDFEGGRGGLRQYDFKQSSEGKRVYHADGGDYTTNASLQVLVLGPDGKLALHNSRDDRNDADRPGNHAFERRVRYESWLQRLQSVRPQPLDTKKGPMGKG